MGTLMAEEGEAVGMEGARMEGGRMEGVVAATEAEREVAATGADWEMAAMGADWEVATTGADWEATATVQRLVPALSPRFLHPACRGPSARECCPPS